MKMQELSYFILSPIRGLLVNQGLGQTELTVLFRKTWGNL